MELPSYPLGAELPLLLEQKPVVLRRDVLNGHLQQVQRTLLARANELNRCVKSLQMRGATSWSWLRKLRCMSFAARCPGPHITARIFSVDDDIDNSFLNIFNHTLPVTNFTEKRFWDYFLRTRFFVLKQDNL